MSRTVGLALLWLPSAAWAQELKFEEYTLPNGLKVIFHEDHSLPQVVVDTWYKVGSKDEVARRSGFAHLFEHLMFMGTTRLPGSGIDETMEGRGGWNNAWTMEDATNYYDVGPSNLLPTLLWIEADRMEQLGQSMTKEKLDLQRDVVRNERRQSIEDQPYASTELIYPGALFPKGHPYAHPVIGSHEDLEAATLADVQDFFATWYVPNNASLVVAGDFDPVATKALIEKYFGHIAKKALPERIKAVAAEGPQIKDSRMPDRVDAEQLDLYWHSPAAYAQEDAEMSLVAEVLGGGESSRLYQRLVPTGLAQDVEASQNSLQYGGVFEISVTALPGVPASKIEPIVREEITKLQTNPPSDAEMSRLKNQYEYSALTELESLQNVAVKLNQYEAYTGTPDYLAKDLARFRAVTAKDLETAATNWLGSETAVRIVVVPSKDAAKEGGK
jgi:zinc protease